jgi:hypothetical protein
LRLSAGGGVLELVVTTDDGVGTKESFGALQNMWKFNAWFRVGTTRTPVGNQAGLGDVLVAESFVESNGAPIKGSVKLSMDVRGVIMDLCREDSWAGLGAIPSFRPPYSIRFMKESALACMKKAKDGGIKVSPKYVLDTLLVEDRDMPFEEHWVQIRNELVAHGYITLKPFEITQKAIDMIDEKELEDINGYPRPDSVKNRAHVGNWSVLPGGGDADALINLLKEGTIIGIDTIRTARSLFEMNLQRQAKKEPMVKVYTVKGVNGFFVDGFDARDLYDRYSFLLSVAYVYQLLNKSGQIVLK